MLDLERHAVTLTDDSFSSGGALKEQWIGVFM